MSDNPSLFYRRKSVGILGTVINGVRAESEEAVCKY
jgi:hypothetical protein